MGWINLSGGVTYYSIADDIDYVHTNLLDFLINMTPGLYALLLITIITTFIGLIVWSVAYTIKRLPT